MSQSKLLEKIKQEAADVIAGIESVSKAEQEAYASETKGLVDALEARFAAALEKDKTHLETVALSKAKQAGNIALQSAKREGVDEVFETAFNDIANSEAAEYTAFFTKIAKEVVPEKASGKAIAARGRADEVKKVLKAVHATADVEESTAVKAGFILDTEEGVYDVTLERVFAETRPKLETDIVTRAL